ncbi:tetratricopeptide repeat protein [Altererythrobacter arenosus]|uniref:Tetratricopeptide repeat protein n=1 Tax=Altererythrobacter arenosus TaxID=3032592 RepID=A0ABY8FRB5_9SPHN|nr:tetratricopeptide repeat protein [Altererythrobacter sp. CAU 1644]WFL77558.1 tetratricopeptide repeat protein [Altererythrobacter sp. CAU 1644]
MALIPSSNKTAEEKKAEKKAAQDDVLLREIDDAVRQEEFAELAKTYGRPLLALLVVGLLAFGGYLFWDSRQEAAMEAQSEALVGALDQLQAGNLDSADQRAAAIADESDGAVRASALMLRAGVALQQGKADEAADLFGQVAASEDSPAAVRDLAKIRQIAATYDKRSPDEVIALLKPLTVPGNAYFGSAGELVAMAYLEKGERKQAGTLFGEIAKSDDVPESLRSRARQMAGLLGVDAIEDVDEFLEEQQIGDSAEAPAPTE